MLGHNFDQVVPSKGREAITANQVDSKQLGTVGQGDTYIALVIYMEGIPPEAAGSMAYADMPVGAWCTNSSSPKTRWSDGRGGREREK